MVATAVRRRFTVEEYHHLGAIGFFAPDERVELIEGELIVMPPIGSRHAACVDRTAKLLFRFNRDDLHIRVQGPVTIEPRSEPQPDILVLRGRTDFYVAGHPRPQDVYLAIEVADSTLAFDLGRKQRMYARAGIRELWVVDLQRDRIHVFRQPEGGSYGEHTIHERGDAITLIAFPELTVVVNDILG